MKYLINVREYWIRMLKKTAIPLKKAAQKIKACAGRLWMLLCRCVCRIAAHKEAIGYYAVLTLVLVALGAAANDYRSRRIQRQVSEALTYSEPGVAVQMKADPTLSPEIRENGYIMPVPGTVIRGFSDDELIWSTTLQLWQTHPAVDIAASPGEAVVSAADGTITEAYSDALYGNVIVVTHDDGSRLRYSSLNTLQMVEVGERVLQGEVISAVGTCSAEAEIGAHIHLEYFSDLKPADFMLLLEKE